MFYNNSKWHQVVRSPDGESRGLPLGKLSIQRAAAMVTIIIMIIIVIKYLKIRNPTKLNPYHKGFSMKGSRQMEGNWPCSITKPLKYSQSELVARLLLVYYYY